MIRVITEPTQGGSKGVTQFMLKRCLNTVLITCISCLVILSGCRAFLKEKLGDSNQLKKATSLAQAQVTHIGEEPLKQFISRRMAFLVKNVSLKAHRTHNNQFILSSDSSGLAVAVSRKGYYLTAHHCVDDPGEYSFLPLQKIKLSPTTSKKAHTNEEESKQYVPVSKETQNVPFLPIRIVWFSKTQDIALISTDKTCKWAFKLAESVPEPNTLVLAGGALEHSAGHIVSIKDLSDNKEAFNTIKHTAPIIPGDSGGPLFSKDGILYGIHSHVNGSISLGLTGVKIKNVYDYAVPVDASWIQHIIQEDQAQQILTN